VQLLGGEERKAIAEREAKLAAEDREPRPTTAFMRVIAGKYRSRPLAVPPGADVRPTSDKLRGTLFNVLTAAMGAQAGATGLEGLEGTTWLDVYAGSGAVGKFFRSLLFVVVWSVMAAALR